MSTIEAPQYGHSEVLLYLDIDSEQLMQTKRISNPILINDVEAPRIVSVVENVQSTVPALEIVLLLYESYRIHGSRSDFRPYFRHRGHFEQTGEAELAFYRRNVEEPMDEICTHQADHDSPVLADFAIPPCDFLGKVQAKE